MKLRVGDLLIDPNREISNKEAIRVERASGLTVKQMSAGLNNGSAIAFTALVWLVRSKTEPGLKFDDVEFGMSELDYVDDDGSELEPAVDDHGRPVVDGDGDQMLRRATDGELVSPKARPAKASTPPSASSD